MLVEAAHKRGELPPTGGAPDGERRTRCGAGAFVTAHHDRAEAGLRDVDGGAACPIESSTTRKA
jgi:hypothetical protein